MILCTIEFSLLSVFMYKFRNLVLCVSQNFSIPSPIGWGSWISFGVDLLMLSLMYRLCLMALSIFSALDSLISIAV